MFIDPHDSSLFVFLFQSTWYHYRGVWVCFSFHTIFGCVRTHNLQKGKEKYYSKQQCSDGKEMYKKAWCTCKVVVLLIYCSFAPRCRRRRRIPMWPVDDVLCAAGFNPFFFKFLQINPSMTSNGGLVAGGIVTASNVLSRVLQSCAENGEKTLWNFLAHLTLTLHAPKPKLPHAKNK